MHRNQLEHNNCDTIQYLVCSICVKIYKIKVELLPSYNIPHQFTSLCFLRSEYKVPNHRVGACLM